MNSCCNTNFVNCSFCTFNFTLIRLLCGSVYIKFASINVMNAASQSQRLFNLARLEDLIDYLTNVQALAMAVVTQKNTAAG